MKPFRPGSPMSLMITAMKTQPSMGVALCRPPSSENL